MLKVFGGIFLLYKLANLATGELLKKFPIEYNSIGFEKANLYESIFATNFTIENKTPANVTITGFDGKLFFSNHVLGAIKRGGSIVLESGKKTIIKFDAVITNKEFLIELSKLADSPIDPVFRLDGKLFIGGQAIPISKEFGLR